jgi:drug/metabolite transporter (DMT)-like permease
VTLTAFLVVSVLAGGNAVGIRFSNRELDPFWGAGLRFAGAALILLTAMAVLRLPMPRSRNLFGALLFGLLGFGGAFALAYYGFQELHAGFGQILLALVPLLTLLLAVLERQDVFRWAAAWGGLLALAGVVVMSQGALRESIPVLSILALVGAAVCFAQAGIVAAWVPDAHPISINAVGMAAAAVVLLGLSFFTGETRIIPDETATWLALVYLIVIGSVIVFVLTVFVIRRWGPTRAAYMLVLIPVFTISYSVWLLDEPVGWELVVGGVLVLAGVYGGALRQPQAPVPSESEAISD